jgi:hypothetical protein
MAIIIRDLFIFDRQQQDSLLLLLGFLPLILMSAEQSYMVMKFLPLIE